MFLLGTGSGARPLSKKIRQFMQQEFGLSESYLRPLHYVTRRANFAGQPVKNMRVFDPAAVQAAGLQVSRYQELDDREALVLFEGKGFRGGRIFFIDHRPRSSLPPKNAGSMKDSAGKAA